MKRKVILGLGSNIGDRLATIQQAEALIEAAIGDITARSEYYESPPWGNLDQSAFINSVISVVTDDLPSELMIKVSEIEKTLGKKKVEHWGPRTIDIDILFYTNWIIKKRDLIVPHPYIQERNFVMQPLLDIEKNLIHPKLNKTIEELYLESPDQSEVKKLPK